MDLGTSSGFPQFGIFRNLKDRSRDYAGFASRGIFGVSQGWTSGVSKCRISIWLPLGWTQKPLGRLGPPPDVPRGTFSGFPILSPLRTDLGVTFPQIGILRPPPDRPWGLLKGGVPFRYPLPDFPVHRGHRISTYRLLIDNSLSFPCLDGQC